MGSVDTHANFVTGNDSQPIQITTCKHFSKFDDNEKFGVCI